MFMNVIRLITRAAISAGTSHCVTVLSAAHSTAMYDLTTLSIWLFHFVIYISSSLDLRT